jgi:hypothetical protein
MYYRQADVNTEETYRVTGKYRELVMVTIH